MGGIPEAKGRPEQSGTPVARPQYRLTDDYSILHVQPDEKIADKRSSPKHKLGMYKKL